MNKRKTWLRAIDELETLLNDRADVKSALEKAITKAGVPDVRDLDGYFVFLEKILTHIPVHREMAPAVEHFHYIVNCSPGGLLLTDDGFQQWLVTFSKEYGRYMDMPESAAALDTFTRDPTYRIDEYDTGPSGWMSFNQFFARRTKPGKRPIAAPCNDRVIVSAADSVYLGCWNIDDDASLTAKGVTYRIAELLGDSPYSNRFSGGIFTHSYLDTTDYHRYHVPTSGVVTEARVIPGRVFVKEFKNGNGDLNTSDEVGFQFRQTRGILMIETAVGLIGVLPIGMGHVSSVNITASPGDQLVKGEEFGYFCYGGSDMILLFERDRVLLTAEKNKHYKQGEQLGSSL